MNSNLFNVAFNTCKENIETIKVKKFAKKLYENYDVTISEIIDNKKIMVISEMLWRYDFFNVAFLNNAVSLILYALYQGCIPIIAINKGSSEYCNWDWYFKQPKDILDISEKVEKECEILICDRKKGPYGPKFDLSFELESEEFKLWKFLYSKFVKLNEETLNYIENEKKINNNWDETIGTVLRGTDYTATKPKHHPIQPEPEEVFDSIKQLIVKNGYKKLYVATEEQRLFCKAAEQFGENVVLENIRTYYDKKYYQTNAKLAIGAIHFDRKNDNYLKGIQYLSSLVLLTTCNAIVAGNSGGTLFSVLYKNSFKQTNIINKGFY